MKPLSLGRTALVAASVLALAPVAVAAPIEYVFGWTASGEIVRTETLAEARFEVTFVGSPDAVRPLNGGYISAGLVGTLTGPAGIATTLTDQFVAIQQPGRRQLLGFGTDISFSVDIAPDARVPVSPAYAAYDLRSAFGPLTAPEYFGTVNVNPLSTGNLLLDPTTARDFRFEATQPSSEAIAYSFAWTQSGSLTTVTRVENAPFRAVLRGDTDDVEAIGGRIANETLTGFIEGPFGLQQTLSGMRIVNQAPGGGQSFGFGTDEFIVRLAVDAGSSFFALAAYDLRGPVARVTGADTDRVFSDPFASDPGVLLDPLSVSNFYFEATTPAPVPEPAAGAMLAAGVLLLLGFGRRVSSRRGVAGRSTSR